MYLVAPKPPTKAKLPPGATPMFPFQPPSAPPKRLPPKPPKSVEWNGNIPIIVSKCLEYVEVNGVKEQGIFRESAGAKELQELKSAFDSGNSLSKLVLIKN